MRANDEAAAAAATRILKIKICRAFYFRVVIVSIHLQHLHFELSITSYVRQHIHLFHPQSPPALLKK